MKKVKFKELPQKLSNEAIQFCLKQIKDEYGYDYNPQWHRDLDSLKTENGDYSKENKGIFLIAQDQDKIIATCGMRNLSFKESNLLLCEKHFGVSNYASLWRTYVLPKYRNIGIASTLVDLALKKAKSFKYEYIYLHTSWNKPKSVSFWKGRGFEIFLEEKNSDQTVHMIKKIS